MGLVCWNGYWSCVRGSVAISGAGEIKLLWELLFWDCSYWLGCCDQMVMGAVLVVV